MVIFKRDDNGMPIFHKSFTLDWDKAKEDKDDKKNGKNKKKGKNKDKKDKKDGEEEEKDDEWTVSNGKRVEVNKMTPVRFFF